MSELPLTLIELQKQYQTKKKIKYVFFWGHTEKSKIQISKACFSQWYPSCFSIDSVDYATAEHYMMAAKARLFNDEPIFQQIINAKSPKQVKALGRKVQSFNNEVWQAHCLAIVVAGNLAKFSQNKELGDFLLSTNDKVLVEASPFDAIWGIGLAEDAENITNPMTWKGTNLLGFALMTVREQLNKA